MSGRPLVPRHKVFGAGGPTPPVPPYLVFAGVSWATSEVWWSQTPGTWTFNATLRPGFGVVDSFVRAKNSPNIVTSAEDDVWVSQDVGASWNLTQTLTMNWTWINEMYTIPSNGAIMAGTGWGTPAGPPEFHRSTDNGLTWANVGVLTLATQIGIWCFCQAANGDVLAGVTYRAGAPFDVWRSTDGGASWAAFSRTSLHTSMSVRDMVLAQDGSLICCRQNAGIPGRIYRSTDNGATWVEVLQDPTNDFILSLCVCDSGHILAGTENSRVWRSNNHGQLGSWSLVASLGPVGVVNWVTDIIALQSIPGRTLLSIEAGGGGPRIYRSDDEFTTWTVEHQFAGQNQAANLLEYGYA